MVKNSNMENHKKPIYPVDPDKIGTTNGLTKREYFAGLAMQGMLARLEENKNQKGQRL